jgi:peroxiredoxin
MIKETRRSESLIYRLAAGILIAAGIAIIYFFGFPTRGGDNQPTEPITTDIRQIAPEEGAFAPDFNLFNTEGESIQLSQLVGQPVLINFWATWCAPCLTEMPVFQDRFERHNQDGLRILAVDFDEPEEDVVFFKEELGLTFDLLLDPGGEIQSLYRVLGYPTSYFVDSEGVIQVQHIGVMTESQLDGYLEQIGINN